jgi:hypothetical protein
MKAREFDQRFDAGEDMSDHVDWSRADRPNKPTRIEMELPVWLVDSLDREAKRLGMTRETLMTQWLSERVSR